jgi:L-lactate dehydrogenase complex protein LldG
MAEANPNAEARAAILSSIREHLAASARFDAAPSPTAPHLTTSISAEQQGDAFVVERFRQALEAVSGKSVIARNAHEAAAAIQRIIDETNAQRIAISDSPLVKKVLDRVNAAVTLRESPKQSELFDCDLGITGAQWAIAETGTLVLESERERNRLASLVPAVHVAIIEASRIRRTMSEVLDLIKGNNLGLNRAVTFITGPSRTSDIELTLAIGVHGPGELHVIVIDDIGLPV